MSKPNPIPNNKPFKKGQSGNPKGRPKLKPLREYIEEIMTDEKEGKTAMEDVILTLHAKAAKGDIRAIDLLLAYTYGKPKQQMDVTTGGDKIATLPAIVIERR